MYISYQKTCLLVLGVLAAVIADVSFAQQKFPTKPIRIVLGSSPGSTPDILSRLIGAKMGENWGQPVVIENRMGASGLIAANTVAKSTPDGYTLLASSPAFAIRAASATNLPFDSLRDFAGVTEIGYSNSMIVVSASLGVKSLKELIAFAQARPGKVFFGTGGAGTSDHMNAERFRMAAGIKAQHVGFKGQSEALIEVAAGRVHFTSAGLTAALPLVKDGKLVALVQRAPGLPGVPLAPDILPEWTQMGSQAILAPAGTPLATRQQLSKEIARILNLPDIRERLTAVAFQIAPTTPEEHERKLRADIVAFAKVIKEIGLKPN